MKVQLECWKVIVIQGQTHWSALQIANYASYKINYVTILPTLPTYPHKECSIKIVTLLFLLFFTTQSSMASSLEDNKLHAVLGVITNFILTDTPTVAPTVAPTFLNDSNISIAENNASALTVELNTTESVTYAITDGNITLFDINSTTGVITFKDAPDYESALILYTFTVTATDSKGNTYTQEITIYITNVLVENAPKLVKPFYLTEFTYSGDANWTEDNTTFYTGTGLWKNADIEDSQSACMEASVNEDKNISLLFIYKVSSESGWDKLKFYIDDSEQESYSGEIDWTIGSKTISSGSHTLKWCYTKDSSGSTGDDTAWVDDIKVGELQYTLAEDQALGEIGNIGIVAQNDTNISSFSIDGNGSEKFLVDTDGRLSLVSKLDYETQKDYTLTFTAHNAIGDSNSVTRTITVTDVDDLYITNAFFDDNHTVDTADDRLLLQYSKTLDEMSIQSPVGSNFVINANGTVDGGDSTGEYNATKTYYPHEIALDGASTLSEQNISIATDTLTASSTSTLDQTKTLIRPSIGSSVVKKTGQTRSYDESGNKAYHQSLEDDGYFQSGVAPQYSRDDALEIVTDHLTGLEWADDANVSSVTKQWLTTDNYNTCTANQSDPACYDTNSTIDPSDDTATEYCDALALGGHGDWRLPTSVELEGIVHHGKISPSIDTRYFKHTSSYYYWSSSTYEGTKGNAWYVFFGSGATVSYYKGNSRYVRCVRVGQ